MSIEAKIAFWLACNSGSRGDIARGLGLSIAQVTNACSRMHKAGMALNGLKDGRMGRKPKQTPQRAAKDADWPPRPSAEAVVAAAIRSRSALEQAWSA